MSENIKAAKDKIRKKILLKRQALTTDQVTKLSSIIISKILRLKKIKDFQNYLIYLPTKNEVDTKLLIHFLIQNRKNIYVPALVENDWTISQFKSLDGLVKNKYKTLQPKKISAVSSNKIDVAIVPGVAFDKKGVRLGYGKGVYDNLLKKFKGLKIGLAYEFQIVERLPAESHDLKTDLIVTEKQVVNLASI
ncbi:5-formyltetrahydrofolate cyclo-ligase [Candidatus Curtissbacteria bacterium RIFCSPLOWO2_12_FULL_38_9]|uniref:5-formyltetrahydrofolate cyclo-ligase n=2 Tax=Candidatus Curtissiibacteriota TaxID=1752717 RepID=A0A1F5G759_9BACT|nr:MAG: 5-formyltetrahydrofolate cyclo-ligase [Candidatus Curtissbacteria bacterium RIFCSPHIGHO2_02_FULL_40_16b]OGE14144.1 MAG: 5-formyltetrahydrofolate cyclo-ligase [Candidatus Curtissbacteria bacterium RIFCSPLOWO2_12_FULL_38_9]